MRDVSFFEADLYGSRFSYTYLDRSNLNAEIMDLCEFADCSLNGATIRVNECSELDFYGCDFEFAAMQGEFMHSRFTQGSMAFADLQGTKFEHCILSNLDNLECASTQSSSISNCALKNVNMVNFEGDLFDIGASIGDATVLLPRDMDRPDDWFRGEADWRDIHEKFRERHGGLDHKK